MLEEDHSSECQFSVYVPGADTAFLHCSIPTPVARVYGPIEVRPTTFLSPELFLTHTASSKQEEEIFVEENEH